MTCPFNTCDGTGLIPFMKDGKLIPNTFEYCQCHESNRPERYHQLTPDDFDFPISHDYYRGLCQEHGWPDPGPLESEIQPEPVKVIYRRRPVDDEIDQLKSGFVHIQNVLNEHVDAAKKAAQKRETAKANTGAYKGIK